MNSVKWIKISTDIFDNRKIRQIENMAESDTIITVWLKILCLAGKANNGGGLFLTDSVPYDLKMLSAEFQRPEEQVKKALDIFFLYRMMEEEEGILFVVNWHKYQNLEKMEEIKEQNRKRKAKQRKLTKKNEQNATTRFVSRDIVQNVTPCHATDIDKDIDIDIDIKTEKENNDCLSVFYSEESADQSLYGKTNKSVGVVDGFEEFFQAYPRHQEKIKAREAYQKAILITDHRTIMEACRKYRSYHEANETSKRFIKYAVTWLENSCWEDELPDLALSETEEYKAREKKPPKSPYNSIFQGIK